MTIFRNWTIILDQREYIFFSKFWNFKIVIFFSKDPKNGKKFVFAHFEFLSSKVKVDHCRHFFTEKISRYNMRKQMWCKFAPPRVVKG